MQHNLISYVPRIVQYTGKFKFGLFSRFQLNVKRSIGSYSNGRVKCWNCGIEKNSSELTFQCSECQRLLMLPDHVNHFDLFDVQQTFSIDQKTLTNRFRQIQNILHPDKFSNKTEKEQELSAEWSSLVNKAYKVLMSPIQRAEYLLQNNNLDVVESNTISDKAFLMEMMERNEQVDDANTKSDLVALLDSIQADIKACITELECHFSENNLPKAKEKFIYLRYLLSIENNIKEKATRIGHIL